MKEYTQEIKKQLGQLLIRGLEQGTHLYYLELVRQKLEERTLQSFDKGDILDGLGQLQTYHMKMNKIMLQIHELIKKLP